MEYESRLAMAALSSVTLHVVALSLWGIGGPSQPGWSGQSFEEAPLVLQLQRPQPRPIARLVDSAAPAETPPESTDRIAEKNTRAQDPSLADGDDHAPRVEVFDEFEELASAVSSPSKAAKAAPPPRPNALSEPEPSAEEMVRTQVAAPESEQLEPRQQEPVQETFQIAKAMPRALPEPEPARSRGRTKGDAKNKGFLSFEAMQHEMAPYLQEVRERVERWWRIALDLNYSGTAPTKAVLDCAINPQGELVHVEIVDPGDSVNYAPLCKEAIAKAAPFPAFPFYVPEIYKSKNLEIRWTFSFL